MKSSEVKKDFQSLYNLGVSQEKQDSMQDALQSYQAALSYAENEEAKSVAFFNMGNTRFLDEKNLTKEKLIEAIDLYKSAIRSNRKNEPAIHNLALAQISLDMMKQQEQQEQQQQDSEDQENQEQEQNENQNEDQENQDQKDNSQNQQDQAEKPEDQEMQAKEIDKNEIENILKMVEKEDKEVQGKIRKQSKSDHSEKRKKW